MKPETEAMIEKVGLLNEADPTHHAAGQCLSLHQFLDEMDITHYIDNTKLSLVGRVQKLMKRIRENERARLHDKLRRDQP